MTPATPSNAPPSTANNNTSSSSSSLEPYRAAFVRNCRALVVEGGGDGTASAEHEQAANWLFDQLRKPSELALVALQVKMAIEAARTARWSTDVDDSRTTTTPNLKTRRASSTTSTVEWVTALAPSRERPAQSKLTREIAVHMRRIDGLYELRKQRLLNIDEKNALRGAMAAREELRRRLKKTQDAAERAKRYRVRKAQVEVEGDDEPAAKIARSQSEIVLSYLDKESGSNALRHESASLDELRLSSSVVGVSIASLAADEGEGWALHAAASGQRSVEARASSSTSNHTNDTIATRLTPSAADDHCDVNSTPTDTVNPQCRHCSATFGSINEFIDHMRTHHYNASSNNELDSDTPTIDCCLCDRVFSCSKDRLHHLGEHLVSTNASFTCGVCDRVFDSAASFRDHFDAAHTTSLFRCDACRQIFTSHDLHQEHMRDHVRKRIAFECSGCEPAVHFDAFDRFLVHVQSAHGSSDTATTVESSSNLSIDPSRVLESSPLTASVVAALLGPQLPTQQPSSSARNLKCFVCDAGYADETALDTHRLLNHCKIVRSDRCAVCRSSVTNLDDFLLHTRLHSTDTSDVSCVICRQTIRNETLLKLHGTYHLAGGGESMSVDALATQLLLHQQPAATFDSLLAPSTVVSAAPTAEELAAALASSIVAAATSGGTSAFVCACGEKFDAAGELQLHSLEHLKEAAALVSTRKRSPLDSSDNRKTKDDSFACTKCSSSFSTLAALDAHSHIHATTLVDATGSRRFNCDRCRQSFASANRLAAHRKRHTGERESKCRICDRRFECQKSLDEHMQHHQSSATAAATSSGSSSASI